MVLVENLSFQLQACPVGPEHNILEPAPEQCQRLWLEQPIISLYDMEVLRYVSHKGWQVWVVLFQCQLFWCLWKQESFVAFNCVC